jgi:hypothetical protein
LGFAFQLGLNELNEVGLCMQSFVQSPLQGYQLRFIFRAGVPNGLYDAIVVTQKDADDNHFPYAKYKNTLEDDL